MSVRLTGDAPFALGAGLAAGFREGHGQFGDGLGVLAHAPLEEARICQARCDYGIKRAVRPALTKAAG